MIWAVVIEVDGTLREIDHKPSLEELQQAVGGWIELVPLGEGTVAFCNEEGKLHELAMNRLAMWLFRRFYPETYDYIAGPFVVIGDADKEGEDTAIPDEMRALLAQMAEIGVP